MQYELAYKARIHKDGNSAAVYVPKNIMEDGDYRVGDRLSVFVARTRGGKSGRTKRD